jgi:hypothetical protein
LALQLVNSLLVLVEPPPLCVLRIVRHVDVPRVGAENLAGSLEHLREAGRKRIVTKPSNQTSG